MKSSKNRADKVIRATWPTGIKPDVEAPSGASAGTAGKVICRTNRQYA